jgi:hypothetical protein
MMSSIKIGYRTSGGSLFQGDMGASVNQFSRRWEMVLDPRSSLIVVLETAFQFQKFGIVHLGNFSCARQQYIN